METERLLKQTKNLPPKIALGMILSNRIDYGSAEGGMISAKQFPALIDDLLEWQKSLSAQDKK